MTAPAPVLPSATACGVPSALPWHAAREAAYQAGRAALLAPVAVPLADCDQATLAEGIHALADMPPFPASCVDGYAVRGPGPWWVTARILAGQPACPLAADGTAAEVATGAMVPGGTEAIIRTEDATVEGPLVSGMPRDRQEWRQPGEEARRGELLVSAGAPVSPAVIGLAAASGHDELLVRPRPRAAVIVLGTELLASGLPSAGRVRDALGPQLPGWLRRLGAELTKSAAAGPVSDRPDAYAAAIGQAMTAGADLVITTGGTMRGPADHLRTVLGRLGAIYAADTVQVRPGAPMLLAVVPGPDGRTVLLAGLPGNPLAAIAGLLTLAAPALAGLAGRVLPSLPSVELAAPVRGRGPHTQLTVVRRGGDGRYHPCAHIGSAALRGLPGAAGFAVTQPDYEVRTGDRVPLLPFPVTCGEY